MKVRDRQGGANKSLQFYCNYLLPKMQNVAVTLEEKCGVHVYHIEIDKQFDLKRL